MTPDCTDIFPQILWAEVASMAIHIKIYLSYIIFQIKILLPTVIFSDMPLINDLYVFEAKYYVHVSEGK
jgi:hypothetical protein